MKVRFHRSQGSAGLMAELVHGAGIQPRKRNNGKGEDSCKNGWMKHMGPTTRTNVPGFTAVEPCKSRLLGPFEP